MKDKAEEMTVVMTDKSGNEVEYSFPAKTAKKRGNKLLKDSYSPAYFGEPFDSAEAGDGS